MKNTAYLDKAFRELSEAVQAFKDQPCELNYFRLLFEAHSFQDTANNFTKPHKPCDSFAKSATSAQ